MRPASPKQQRHPTGHISGKWNDEMTSNVSSLTQAEPLWNYLPFWHVDKGKDFLFRQIFLGRFWLCCLLVSWAIKCVNSYQGTWTVLTRSKRQLLFLFFFRLHTYQGWNSCPLPCKCGVNLWTTGEVPMSAFICFERTVRSLESTYKIL